MNSRVRTLLLAGAALLAPLSLAAATGVANLSNISTRLQIETGDSVGIAGFIVQGTGNKQVLIRALGPSLTALGVAGALADPTLELHDASGQIIATNDNWDQGANIQAWHTSLGLTLPQASESVISMSLAPGAYTAIVRGVNGTSGVALVEAYDCDATAPCAPINISTRGVVRLGPAVMIGGFIVQGTIPKQVLVRAIGPTLATFGVSNVLTDPQLDIYDGTGAKIYSNNDWQTQSAQGVADVTATGKAPPDPRESALVVTLNPGAYTAIVSGNGGAQGNALVEVYDLQPTNPAPAPSSGTLYLADLRAAPGVTTSGSGTAALSVNQAGTQAIVSVSYSNLSGPITNAHLEASADSPYAGLNLFDLSPNAVQADGTWVWNFAFTNSNLTVAEILTLIEDGQIDIRIYTAANPGGELFAAFSAAAGGQTFTPPAAPPGLPGGAVTANDASRLLSQSTFGPTNGNPATDKTSVGYVQNKGIDAWLNEQIALPTTSLMSYINSVWDPSIGNTQGATAAHYGWWVRSVTAPDQFRQRVAYALSQIVVASSNSSGLNSNPIGIGAYYDVILNDAFGNFRQLLNDITLNPGMGEFLDMAGNAKGNVAAGTNPNENYAREVNQLFSIGLYQLHPDGTLELDGRGLPIPTYTQPTVTGFARVFTGWNYAAPVTSFPPINLQSPMIKIATRHEPGSKSLLNGMTIPTVVAATTTEMDSDLKTALDNIFYHPNVGPFIARQLIQRLVTSNPSPGYVYRVAQVFANNGAGVRGDLKAVVLAILKDYEARTTDLLGFQGTGKQIEPVLRTTKTMRAFVSSPFTSGGTLAGPFYNFDTTFGQTPLRALTVFNFYGPDYAAPGDISSAGLVSPEFEITTETTVVSTANFIRALIFNGQGAGATKVSLDFSAFTSLATTNPSAMLDQLNVLLMAGQMDANMKTQILTAVTPISANDGGFNRVRNAVYLITSSPQYATQR
jgi:uncharacterized protein (DUF1800 family)